MVTLERIKRLQRQLKPLVQPLEFCSLYESIEQQRQRFNEQNPDYDYDEAVLEIKSFADMY